MSGILAIWNDCAPNDVDQYERWYCREHLAERVGIPGFRFGRRYEAIQADRRYFTFYEVDDPAVLTSQAYLERLNRPTDDTRRAMASFRGMMRTVCDLDHSVGVLHGASVVTLRFADRSPATEQARAVVERFAAQDGVARAQLWTASAVQTPGGTKEMTTREVPDDEVPATIIVECLRQADSARVAAQFSEEVASRLSPSGRTDIGTYTLLCTLERGQSSSSCLASASINGSGTRQ